MTQIVWGMPIGGWIATVGGIALLWAVFFPLIKILRRLGLSGWWSLMLLAGPFWFVGLWLLAYCKWPAADRAASPNWDTKSTPSS